MHLSNVYLHLATTYVPCSTFDFLYEFHATPRRMYESSGLELDYPTEHFCAAFCTGLPVYVRLRLFSKIVSTCDLSGLKRPVRNVFFLMVCSLSPVSIPFSSKVVPYEIPLADERTTREAQFSSAGLRMTKPKATEMEISATQQCGQPYG